MNNYIDTHFHLDHYRNYNDIAKKISELEQYTICVTDSPGIFLSCKRLLCETKYLKFAIGYHPQNAQLSKKDFNDFIRLIDSTNYVGEIGLDFSSNNYQDRKTQLEYFERIIKKCSESNKLMTIHIRRAEKEAIKIIEKYRPQKAVIHWYTGNEKDLNRLIELGCYFSINSNMVVTSSAVKYLAVPKNRILIESDGPHTRVGGKRYNPSLLPASYDAISKFFNNPSLRKDVYNNFKELLEK